MRLDPSTARDFVTLLETVFLVHRLPAWGRNLGLRTAALPKVHIVDCGLAAHLVGINVRRLAARTPDVLTRFGHVLETFAVNEIIQQGGLLDEPITFGHFRTHDRVEVDLVALRNKLGSQFVGGVVLYLGSRAYTIDDRIHVLPPESLWTA